MTSITQALAYHRVSPTKNRRQDTFARDRKLCRAFARKNRMKLEGEYLDFETRGEFFDCLLRDLKRSGIKTVIVAEATTLARSPIERETIILELKALGVSVVTCAGDDLSNDLAKEPMRQAALKFAWTEATVAKLHMLKLIAEGRRMALARRASAPQHAQQGA